MHVGGAEVPATSPTDSATSLTVPSPTRWTAGRRLTCIAAQAPRLESALIPRRPHPSSDLDLPSFEKGKKLTGAERAAFAEKVVAAYRTPHRKVTIREICEVTKRSYGAIHSLSSEAGATKRGPDCRRRGTGGPAAA